MNTTEDIRATFPSNFLGQTTMGKYAMDCAAEHLNQGWIWPGKDYHIGNFPGDVEVYEQKTGEKLSRPQLQALEHNIRQCLDAAWIKMIEDNPALND